MSTDGHHAHVTPIDVLRRQHDEYRHGADRPLTGYLGLLATYGTLTAAATATIARRGRLARRVGLTDLALLAVTTFRISRLITKDSVTGAVRAPFTEYKEAAGEGEVNEEVRGGTGWRHAVGELVTCPFCLGQWVATAATTGMYLAPDVTRFAGTICATGVASDLFQLGWSSAKEALG
ncbi:MAG TPA: DUF1360 domain-containing protein [Acidimicrobiales bacterium]|nr:DUF1360 domain-containing protein [Acidimicrobiales bacterium]